MSVDLSRLGADVLRELDEYEIPRPGLGQFGSPLPDAWFEEHLAHMRMALVEPYLQEITVADTSQPKKASVAVVANDGQGVLLAYDPAENDFVLIFEATLSTFNVRGDAVGCFLAI